MTAIITLNATVAQIEDALESGKTVEEVARELGEPRVNVFAVYRQMQDDGTAPRRDLTKAQPVTGASQSRPFASVPPQTSAAPFTPVAGAADPLIAAAARSLSKRTQALGVRLAETIEQLRTRLHDEREDAERQQRQQEERLAVEADVKRLTERLAAARAKLRGDNRGGSASMSRPDTSTADRMAHARAAQIGEFPCSKGCGKVAKSVPGQRSHERHCTGGAA